MIAGWAVVLTYDEYAPYVYGPFASEFEATAARDVLRITRLGWAGAYVSPITTAEGPITTMEGGAPHQ